MLWCGQAPAGCWTVSDPEGEIVLNNVAVTSDWLVVTAGVGIDCVWPDCRISSGATGHTKYCARRGWHPPMPRLNPISCGDPLVSPTSIHATNGLKSPSIMAGKIVTGKKSLSKMLTYWSHFINFSWLVCRWTLDIDHHDEILFLISVVTELHTMGQTWGQVRSLGQSLQQKINKANT